MVAPDMGNYNSAGEHRVGNHQEPVAGAWDWRERERPVVYKEQQRRRLLGGSGLLTQVTPGRSWAAMGKESYFLAVGGSRPFKSKYWAAAL